MIHQQLPIVVFVVATGSVFQLECSGREKQSHANEQEQDCDASKPRSGALVLHEWIDDAKGGRFTRNSSLLADLGAPAVVPRAFTAHVFLEVFERMLGIDFGGAGFD